MDKTDERIVAGKISGQLLDTAEKLNELGYTNTEIVKQGIRLLGRREKVCA